MSESEDIEQDELVSPFCHFISFLPCIFSLYSLLLLFGIDVHRDDTIFSFHWQQVGCVGLVFLFLLLFLSRSSWVFRTVGLLSDSMGYVSSFYGVGDLEPESVSSMVLIIKNPDINCYLAICKSFNYLSRHTNQAYLYCAILTVFILPDTCCIR